MSQHLKATVAIFLITLITVFGQGGLRQCLCTGQIAHGSADACECTGSNCCPENGQPTPAGDTPSPCGDETCWLVISLGSADQPAPLATTAPAFAVLPEAFAGVPQFAPRPATGHPPVRQRPPDLGPVRLTVLFSSFLV